MSLIGGLNKQAVAGALGILDEIKYLFWDSGNLDGHALPLMDMVQFFIKAIGT